jgi:hypothetical protein
MKCGPAGKQVRIHVFMRKDYLAVLARRIPAGAVPLTCLIGIFLSEETLSADFVWTEVVDETFVRLTGNSRYFSGRRYTFWVSRAKKSMPAKV